MMRALEGSKRGGSLRKYVVIEWYLVSVVSTMYYSDNTNQFERMSVL
jgi:hypothetical protein